MAKYEESQWLSITALKGDKRKRSQVENKQIHDMRR